MNSRHMMIANLRAAQAANSSARLTSRDVTDVLNVFEEFCEPPAALEWVVTWTLVQPRFRRPVDGLVPTFVVDGTSTFTSWPAVLDYIDRIVPYGATFTVKLA